MLKKVLSGVCIIIMASCANVPAHQRSAGNIQPFSSNQQKRFPSSTPDLQSIMVNEMTKSTKFIVNRDLPALDIPGKFGTKEALLESDRKSSRALPAFAERRTYGAKPSSYYFKNHACDMYHGNDLGMMIDNPNPVKKGWTFEVLKVGYDYNGGIAIDLIFKRDFFDFNSYRNDPTFLSITCRKGSVLEDSTLNELSIALENIFLITP